MHRRRFESTQRWLGALRAVLYQRSEFLTRRLGFSKLRRRDSLSLSIRLGKADGYQNYAPGSLGGGFAPRGLPGLRLRSVAPVACTGLDLGRGERGRFGEER